MHGAAHASQRAPPHPAIRRPAANVDVGATSVAPSAHATRAGASGEADVVAAGTHAAGGVAAAAWVEAPEEDGLAGPNLRQHAWPSRTPSPGGGDILARIIKVLHQRVDLGLFTILIKIRAHWGEFLNKKADRWDDKGRDDVGNLQWDGPCSHSTFSWTEAGVEHRCSMNKFLRAGVHLKVGLFATVSLQELYT